MAKFENPVVHRNLTLVHCQTPAVLQETLAQLDLSDVPHLQLGAKTLLVPKTHLDVIVDALHGIGVFPSVVGDPSIKVPEPESESDDSNDEEAEDA